MNEVPLLVFAISGGIPPESSEMIKIGQDGRAVCIVGNAWPEGQPQNETGLYDIKLSPAEIEVLKSFISKYHLFTLKEEYGPVQTDSGFNILHLYNEKQEKQIRWNPFAELPDPLRNLRNRLREIIQESRQYPVQALKASLQLFPHKIKTAQTFKLELRVKSCGSSSIRLFIPSKQKCQEEIFAFYPAQTEEVEDNFVPALEFYHSAQPIPADECSDFRISEGVVTLRPEEEIEFIRMVPATLVGKGTYRLYGFVNSQLEIIMDNKPQIIDCFMITQPAILYIWR